MGRDDGKVGHYCCGVGADGCKDGWEPVVVGGLGRLGEWSKVPAADVRLMLGSWEWAIVRRHGR